MSLPGNMDPGSIDLHRKVVKTLEANGIGDQLLEVIRKAYQETMSKHRIVLNHAESERLFARVMRSVLEGMLGAGRPPT
jgi:hypothetical protein